MSESPWYAPMCAGYQISTWQGRMIPYSSEYFKCNYYPILNKVATASTE